MRKNLKRILSSLLAVVMILCAMPVSGSMLTAGAADIPSDAVEFNGHYYKVFNENKTWTDSQKYCEGLGGHLITITSSAEQSFTETIIKNAGLNIYWIGMSTEQLEPKWITGELFSYSNWSEGNPDNSIEGEYYVHIYAKDHVKDNYTWQTLGQWNDLTNEAKSGEGTDENFYNLASVGFICEWEPFPDGYDFNRDSYNFENYSSMIPYGYFKTMYGDAKGYELWKNEWYQGGLCFGFSYTTAAFYNNLPSCSSIRGLSKSSTMSIGNNGMSVATYIKYAHLYQFSMEYKENSVWSDARTIYNLVKQATADNTLIVTIGMSHNTDGGHRVLAVGIDGNDILIDDPNYSNNIQRITVNDDGSWSFSGLNNWNSTTCRIRYSMDIAGPFKFLRSLKTLTANEAFIDDSTIDSFALSYEADTLSENNLLLAVNGNEYNIANTDISKIETEKNNDTASYEQADLYWLSDDKTVTVTGINENSEISLAGNDNIIGVTTSDSSNVELTVDEEKDIITAKLDTTAGNDYTFDTKRFDENSDVIAMTVSGTASSDTVTATQTETGLVVTGLSDGTVTLSKDDEVIETQEISNATSDIEITYDKTGESDDVSLDYDHSHTDPDADGKCDICGETLEAVKNCTHLCHKTGFLGFIWKIVNIFNKLFKINPVCSCGMKHY